jgi:uroporphyrinogen-III decarboxylase
VQVVEALTPQPMTSIDLAETRRIWGDTVCLWGALASIILTDSFSDDECERYMEKLFRTVAPGDRFILGFGDNVPTDASWSRIQQVVRFWQRHGDYPLSR